MVTKATAAWETALTGVAKTVDAEKSVIAALGDEFVKLSERIPVSSIELAKVGELAGQLGIAVPNIIQFTEVIAKVGVTTNLSTEQAALGFARFINVVGTAETDVDRIGAAIVDLGNNFATLEDGILEVANRLASAGRIVGLTEGEILGLSAALKSVGIESQAGGTALSKTLFKFKEAIDGQTASVRIFAKAAGLSVLEFSELFRKDAAGALQVFIEGLDRIDESGGNVTKTLDELGLADVRQIRALLSLAKAGTLLGDAFERGNRAFEENIALNEEAEKFFATLTNRFKLLRNQLSNTFAIFGDALRPAIEAVLDSLFRFSKFLRRVAKDFSDLPASVRKTVGAVALILAALGPLVFILGTVITLIGFAAQGLGTTFVVGLKLATKAVRGFSIALLTNPIGLIAVGIALAVAALVIFRDEVVELEGTTARVRDFVGGTFDALAKRIGEVSETIKMALNAITTSIGTLFGGIFKGILSQADTFAELLIDVISFAVNGAIKRFQLLAVLVKTQFAIITTVISNALGIVKDTIAGIVEFLSPLGSVFKSVFSGIGTRIANVFGKLSDRAGEFFGIVKQGLEDLDTGVAAAELRKLDEALGRSAEGGNILARLFKGVPDIVADSLDELTAIAKSDPAGEFFAEVFANAGERFVASQEATGEEGGEALAKGLAKAKEKIKKEGTAAATGYNAEFLEGIGKGFDAFVEAAQDGVAAGEEVFTTFAEGLTETIQEFVKTGKLSFKELGQSILDELANQAIRRALASLFQFGAAAGSNLFGGGTQQTGGNDGGIVQSIVGGVGNLFAGGGSGASSGGSTGGAALGNIGSLAGIGFGLASLFGSRGGTTSGRGKAQTGIAPAGLFLGARRFQGGGLTGPDTIPALLSKNEAVVPLSGGAIPVDLGGPGGAGQNITVNVNMRVLTPDPNTFRENMGALVAAASLESQKAFERNR